MKNAIVYLTRSSQLELLSRSIGLLCDNFLPWNPADVFVFHEADADMSALRAASARANPTFCLVDFSSIPAGCETLTQAQRGYRSMCRFFANEWFLRPELDGYDFVMRMDVDSFILSPCRENLFARMDCGKLGYAYRAILKDSPRFCTGLWETADDYFREAGITPKARLYRDIRRFRIFYTNFEICRLSWFRSPVWQSFFSAIDKAGGIARHRWGDAPIRYVGVRALMEASEIWQATPLHYQHWYRWRAGSRHREPRWLLLCYARTLKMLLAQLSERR